MPSFAGRRRQRGEADGPSDTDVEESAPAQASLSVVRQRPGASGDADLHSVPARNSPGLRATFVQQQEVVSLEVEAEETAAEGTEEVAEVAA